MSLAKHLTSASDQLTAAEAASAVSPLLSRRTMEDWLQARRTPPPWSHEWILARVRARAKRQRPLRPSNTESQTPR